MNEILTQKWFLFQNIKDSSLNLTFVMFSITKNGHTGSGGSSGVAEWAVPTQNQMTYFFLILFSFLNLSIIYLMICY
jgi:hypothetical protein